MSVLDPVKAGENIAILEDYYKNSETVDLYRKGDRLEILDFSGCCCVWFSRIYKCLRGFTKVDPADRLGETARLVDLYATPEFVKSIANDDNRLLPMARFVNSLRGSLIQHIKGQEPNGLYPANTPLPLDSVLKRINTFLLGSRPAPSLPIDIPNPRGSSPAHTTVLGDGSSRSSQMDRCDRPAPFHSWGYFVGTLSNRIPSYFLPEERDALWDRLRPRRERGVDRGILKETFTQEETEAHFRDALAVADRGVKIRINRGKWESLVPGLKRIGIPDFVIERIKQTANLETAPGDFKRHIQGLADSEISASDIMKQRMVQKLLSTYNEIATRVGVPALASPDQLPSEWFFDSKLDRNFPLNLTQLIIDRNRFPKNVNEVYTPELGEAISHASGIIILDQDRAAEYNRIAASINQKISGVGMIANYF